jgi:hypothetical protein
MATYRENHFVQSSLSRYVLPIIAGLIFLGAYLLGYLKTGQILLISFRPQFSDFYLGILFLIITSVLLFLISIINHHVPVNLPQKIRIPFTTIQVPGLPQLSINTGLVLWSILGLYLASTLLFMVSPVGFAQLSNEDQIIEITSALLLFLACANLVVLYLDNRANTLKDFWLAGLLLLAAAFFVIAMEEVSWFQRSFGFQTPEALSGNSQGELNLHNFASNASELIYYFASFIYLIAFPFVYDQIKALSRLKVVAFFAPGLTTLFVSAPLAAFNYGLWNSQSTQFAFFATLAILIFYLWRSVMEPMVTSGAYGVEPLGGGPAKASTPSPAFVEPATMPWLRYYLIALSLVCLLAQVIFIGLGHTFVKGWEVTEYKEFFIPIGFYVYSLELIMRQKGTVGSKFIVVTVGTGLIVAALRLLQVFQN